MDKTELMKMTKAQLIELARGKAKAVCKKLKYNFIEVSETMMEAYCTKENFASGEELVVFYIYDMKKRKGGEVEINLADDRFVVRFGGSVKEYGDIPKKRKPKPSPFDKLDKMGDNVSLEGILIALNGGEKEPMFLKNIKRDKNGDIVKVFTKKGARRYGELVSLLFAVGRLTGDSMEDTVETLDGIADNEF